MTIDGTGDNAVVQLKTLVGSDRPLGFDPDFPDGIPGLFIKTDGPKVNLWGPEDSSDSNAFASSDNSGDGIRILGTGHNVNLMRTPAVDEGSGTFDPPEFSPLSYRNQGMAIDLGAAGPSANTATEWFHPVLDTADLTDDGFLDITGRLGEDSGYFLQFYATGPSLDGRGELLTPIGNYAQIFSNAQEIPQDILDSLPNIPSRIFDQDSDPEQFRFRIEVGEDFSRSLLTAVVVDPTMGQAESEFVGISELAPMIQVGSRITALPPELDVGSDERIFADDLFQRTVSFRDEDSTDFELVVDYGQGNGFEDIAYRPEDRSIFLEQRYTEVGTYVVTVRVMDDTMPLGQIDIESFTVTVENTPPDIRFNEFVTTKSVLEGETFDLTGYFDDLNLNDTHQISIDWGDGLSTLTSFQDFSDTSNPEQNTFDFTHVYLDDGVSRADAHVYRVIVSITDEHGAEVDTPVFLIEVDNVLPEVASGSLDGMSSVTMTTIDEGQAVTLHGSLTDVGLVDSHDIWIDWGDGSPRQRVQESEITHLADDPLRTFAVSHTYTDNHPPGEPYKITWTVEDDDAPGQVVTAPELTVQVNNVAPVIDGPDLELNQTSLREGLTSVLFFPFDDPGTEAYTATVDWGDGNTSVHDIDPGADSVTVSHRYLQDSVTAIGDPEYTISVTINDGTVDSTPEQIEVEITDAPITISGLTLSATDIDEGEEVTVTGNFSSPSPTDIYEVEIDWGNGETSRAQADNAAGTFTATYRYDDGEFVSEDFMVDVSVTNGTTTATEGAGTVTVNDVAPTVAISALPGNDTTVVLRAEGLDPSQDDFGSLTYTWTVATGTTTNTFTGDQLTLATSTIASSTIVSLQATDNDGGTSAEAKTAFVVGTSAAETLTVTDTSYPTGVSQMIVAGLGRNDILNATGVTAPNSVVLIGGSGDDLLFDGGGRDIILLADGNDTLNPPVSTSQPIMPNAGGDDIIYAIPNSILTAYDTVGNNTLSFELAHSTLTQTDGITFDLSQTTDSLVEQDVAPNSSEPGVHKVAAYGRFTTLVGSDYGDSLTGASNSTVSGGAGEDQLFAAANSINPTFRGGADDDVLNVDVTVLGDLNFGGDDGFDELRNTGTITDLDFLGGADDDILQNVGTITDLDFLGGADDDVLQNTGTITDLDFLGGADDDILQNTSLGVIENLIFGGDDGFDMLLNSATITDLQFDGGADDDIFINNGLAQTDLNFGGDDDILLTGEGIIGDLNFGGDDGADIFVNVGQITGVLTFDGGADDDLFLNVGGGPDVDNPRASRMKIRNDDEVLLTGFGVIGDLNFTGDDGADVLLNSGEVTSLTFLGGADDDIFINNGLADTDLNFGGDDEILLAGTGVIGDLDFSGDDGVDMLLNLGQITTQLTFQGGADGDLLFNVGADDALPGGDPTGSRLNIGGDDEILLVGEGVIADLNFGGDDGANLLFNTGTVTTLNFTGGADDDVLINNGLAATDLNFGGDDEVLLVGDGVIQDLNFGGDDGFDELRNLGTITDLDFLGGADDDILQNVGTITDLDFLGGADDDVLQNVGTITDLDFLGGADDDILQNTSLGVIGNLDFGGDDGFDVLRNTGTITDLDFGGGADDDVLQNMSLGVIGNLNFGGDQQLDVATGTLIDSTTGDDGFDVLQNFGTITDLDFTGGADDDVLQNASLGVIGNLNFGGDDGFDVLLNTGTIQELDFLGGADDDTLIALGSITTLNFNGGADDDVLQVNSLGLQTLNFTGDDGNDIFVNRTSTLDSLTFDGGADNDILINRGDDITTLTFDGGEGDDSFVNRGNAPSGVTKLEFIGGNGSNAFRNEGENWQTVNYVGGNDADFFQNNGPNISGLSYTGGIGSNAFENNADFLSGLDYTGSTGDDVFANDGNSVSGLVFNAVEGRNTLLNTGRYVSNLTYNGGPDNDLFVNRGDGLSNSTFNAQSGDDVFLNQGKSLYAMEFIGGAGADLWFNHELGEAGTELIFTASSQGTSQPDSIDDAADRFINEAQGQMYAAYQTFLNFEGGVGDDQYVNRGDFTGGTIFNAGPGNDIVYNDGQMIGNLEMNGGEGDDTFENRGTADYDSTFRLIGGDGNDSFLQNLGSANTIEVIGGAGNDSLLNFSHGVDSLLLDGGEGQNVLQNTGDQFRSITVTGDVGEQTLHNFGDGHLNAYKEGYGARLFLNLTSDSTAGDLINHGRYLTSIQATTEGPTLLMSRGDNVDGISATTGVANDAVKISGSELGEITLNTGDGADSVQIDGTSRTEPHYEYQSLQNDITVNTGDGNDLLQLRGIFATLTADAGSGDDRFVYSATADHATLDGDVGDDGYSVSGAPAGMLTIEEAYSGSGDSSTDLLDFSAFTSGAITLDLARTTAQPLPAAGATSFTMTLTDGRGIENVIGTTGADTISGNAQDNHLQGARYTGSDRSYENPVGLSRTQWVVLDFVTETVPGEIVYSEAVGAAIQQSVEASYDGFNVQIVRRHDHSDDYKAFLPADIRDDPSQYVTIFFNSTPPSGRPGGQASEIDVGNVNPGGTADVQISGMLSGREVLFSGTKAAIEADGHEFQAPDIPKPAATEENLIALSSKLAAHELAHLLGMRHYDGYGPIGFGINATPGHHNFNPNFPGPAASFETADHIISSPASAGTDRFNDLRELYFGQREAVKLALAFSDPAAVLHSETSNPHGSRATAEEIQPVTLNVPNTASRGINESADFQAQGIVIAGSIGLQSGGSEDGQSESDWYSFAGFEGDVVTVEVMSRALARYSNDENGNLDHTGYIDSVLRLYDSTGTLVTSYGQDAVNDDEFESSDSLLLDIVLPDNGTYYIEVDTFSRDSGDASYADALALRAELEARKNDSDPTNDLNPDEQQFLNRLVDSLEDTDTGHYDLVMYVSSSTSATDGTDTLQGREGVDTFVAGDDDDYSLSVDLTGADTAEAGSAWSGTASLVDRGGYTWTGTVDFGDGTTGTWSPVRGASTIQHTYSEAGTYTVTITVTNDDGLQQQATFELTVEGGAEPLTLELDINEGLENRSAVKTADIVFSDESFVDDLFDPFSSFPPLPPELRIQVEQLDLHGNSLPGQVFLTPTFSRVGNRLRFDFGSLGLRENGVYAIRIDTDGDPFNGFEKEVRFHRLEGDVNGDGKVDRADQLKTRRAYRRPHLYADADVDGDGDVDRLDLRAFSRLSRIGFPHRLGFDRDELDD